VDWLVENGSVIAMGVSEAGAKNMVASHLAGMIPQWWQYGVILGFQRKQRGRRVVRWVFRADLLAE
jgi:hypothetical protein